MDGATQTKKN